MRRLRAILLILLLSFSIFQFFQFAPSVKANPDWLSGWRYRKSHVINSASGAGTNYQVRIKVHYGSGTDSGEDVYLNEHCRTDFGDIRFTDDDGVTELDYWMEKKVDSDYAIFWVEVKDDLSSSDATIYIYYGNSDATTTSDGEATFLFFDDFEGSTLSDEWTWQQLAGSGSYTIQNSELWISGDADGAVVGIYSTSKTYEKCVFEAKARANGTYPKGTKEAVPEQKLNDNPSIGAPNNYLVTYTWKEATTDSVKFYWYTGSWDSEDLYETNAPTTYKIWRIIKNGFSFFAEYLDTDYSVIAETSSWKTVADFTFYIGLRVADAVTGVWDWVRIRKYVDPEPTHGSWGSEEEVLFYSNLSPEDDYICQSITINFSCYWQTCHGNLSHYIFSYKIGENGTWTNETYSFPEGVTEAWSNVTKNTLEDFPDSKGKWIYWCFYANNTSGQWKQTETRKFEIDVESDEISLIGESTSEYPIIGMYQRWCFYAKGLFWAFYSNGTHMVYASGNGTSWNSSVAVRPSTNGYYFSIWFDGTYVHYAFANCSVGNSLYYRRGTPHANGTITWQTEQTVLTVSSPMAIHRPTIATDSQGYPWIGYALYNDSSWISHPYVVKSSTNNGTWVTAEGFPYQLTTEDFIGIWSSTVIPLSNGKMAAVYAKHGGTVKVRAWNSSAWTVETNTTNAVSMACMLSAVGEEDYVHIAFHKTSTYDLIYAKYSFASNSFINETTLECSMTSTTGPTITIDSAGNLYIFWFGSPNEYYVYYRKYNASTNSWESRVDWLVSTKFKREDYCISFYHSYDGYIGFMFVTGSSSPYEVKFAYLEGSPLQPSNIGATSNVANSESTFHAKWLSPSGLSHAEFYWNASGSMQQNGTLEWTDNPTEAWSNFTRTLPNVQVIAWYIVAYDVYGNSGNTSIQILVLGLNLTLTFYETASVSALQSGWKGLAVSLVEQIQISDSSWRGISLMFRFEEAGSVTDVAYCWREAMIRLSESFAFTDSQYFWRGVHVALQATFSVTDVNSFRKGMLIVVLANPKTSATNYASFEILIISLEVINSETPSFEATALMWKAKSFSMQELTLTLENIQVSKEIAVIAFEFTSPETINMQDLIEMLKAIGFTQQEIANAEITQIQNKEKTHGHL